MDVRLTVWRSVAAWKARWAKECLSSVVMGTLTAETPKYASILELDRRIRDLSLPKFAQGPPPKDATFSQAMTYFMPSYYLHTCKCPLSSFVLLVTAQVRSLPSVAVYPSVLLCECPN